MKQACLYHVSRLSQIWSSRLYVKTDCVGEITAQSVSLAGLSVNVIDRPVSFPGKSVSFHIRALESGIFITDKP